MDDNPGTEQLEEELAGSTKTFRDFGIAEPICAALEAEGITTAFPIQALTLPVALDGHDLIGQARTGTGKTLAFGIPILERLGEAAREPAAPRALVVVPTRELAIQVADDLRVAGAQIGASVVTLYGGRAYEPQIDALANVDIVVGTPGRLLDLARQGHLKLGKVRQLVLDEADKMLDLGFLPDVERILQLTPATRQTMLFSATMPGEVVTLARRHLSRPMHIRAEQHDEPAHVPSTEQHVFRAHQMDKIEVLARVLQAEGRGLTIVFSRTKRSADQVATTLTAKGFAAAAIHGDLGQSQRERAMRAFRSGKVDVLVATEVAARGLDVEDVTHVINYECPEDEKAYLHRIGRTGRAGRDGVAVTFVDWNDLSPVEDHQRHTAPGLPRAARDLLDLGASVRRAGHPGGRDRRAATRPAGAGSAWRPRRSRTSARPARPDRASTGPGRPVAQRGPDSRIGGTGSAASLTRPHGQRSRRRTARRPELTGGPDRRCRAADGRAAVSGRRCRAARRQRAAARQAQMWHELSVSPTGTARTGDGQARQPTASAAPAAVAD